MELSPRPQSLSETLKYFAKHDFSLSTFELWFWQHRTQYSLAQVKKYYNHDLNTSRLKKNIVCQPKWRQTELVGQILKKIPGIMAVFVTGSLAMDSAKPDDDIDLLLVVAPNTLWIIRPIVNLLFNFWRRKPRTTGRANDLCFNLWLDINNLQLEIRNLYVAHEVLQTKLLWEKAPVSQAFLQQNAWVKQFLPVAYEQLTQHNLKFKISNLNSNFIFKILNFMMFVLQYLYMKPKMTSERIGLGYAFFHPSS